MSEFVTCEITDGVALVTLNRPERMNAMGPVMGEQFDQIMVRAGADDSVKVVVITGAGKGFCAGADVERLDGLAATGGKSFERRPPDQPDPVYDALSEAPPHHRARYVLPSALPKPVIAAINGATAGVGFSMACACDIRFGSTQAMFTTAFPRRGLTAEAGLAFNLPRIVGWGAAADILMSSRKVYAEEAKALGLLGAVYEPGELLEKVMDYARDIASTVSPRSMRVIKNQLWAARSQTFAEAMMLAYHEVVASLASEDFQEGLASFKEKRPPRFTGR
ncbi:MAG: enoyl-CoA hydratase-related protein [Ignavibacteriales bacterium]